MVYVHWHVQLSMSVPKNGWFPMLHRHHRRLAEIFGGRRCVPGLVAGTRQVPGLLPLGQMLGERLMALCYVCHKHGIILWYVFFFYKTWKMIFGMEKNNDKKKSKIFVMKKTTGPWSGAARPWNGLGDGTRTTSGRKDGNPKSGIAQQV